MVTISELSPVKVEVELYKEDISRGLSNWMSSLVLGEHIPGIWHASIVIKQYKTEFAYNCDKGVVKEYINKNPGGKVLLGYTEKSPLEIVEFLDSLELEEFHVRKYSLFSHNCITFAERLSNFLVGCSIPEELLKLPQRVKGLLHKAAFKTAAFNLALLLLTRVPAISSVVGGSSAVALFSPLSVAVFALPYMFASSRPRRISSESFNSAVPQSGVTSTDSSSFDPVLHQCEFTSIGSTSFNSAVTQSGVTDIFKKSARSDLWQMYLRCYQREARGQQ